MPDICTTPCERHASKQAGKPQEVLTYSILIRPVSGAPNMIATTPTGIASTILSVNVMSMLAQVVKNVMTAPRKMDAYTAKQMTIAAPCTNSHSRPSHAGSPVLG